jgi:hypothetical protein
VLLLLADARVLAEAWGLVIGGLLRCEARPPG